MFKLINKIEDILDARFVNNSIFHKSKARQYKLIEREKNTSGIVWESEQCNVSDYAFHGNNLVFDSDDNNTTLFLSLDVKAELSRFNFKFSFDNDLLNEKYLIGNSRKRGINILDIDRKSFFTIPKEDYSAYLLIKSNVICINKSKNLITNRYLITKEFPLNWQFDITQFGTYKEAKVFADKEPEERQREIKRVYYHQDKIIVSLSRAVIALNPENGKLLWKIDFEEYTPVDIVFRDNYGYMGDVAYYVIDIDKGEIATNSRFDENIEIEGNKIRWVTSGSGLVFHNGFLWCVFNDKGNNYLVKLNPQNGKLLDSMKLETKAPSTKPPVFDGNRMYILDQDGLLLIYEKQS